MKFVYFETAVAFLWVPTRETDSQTASLWVAPSIITMTERDLEREDRYIYITTAWVTGIYLNVFELN